MKSQTRRIIIILLFLAGAFVVYHFYNQNLSILGATKTVFFEKTQNNAELENIVSTELRGKKGHFAIYIEELEASPSVKLTVKSTSEEPGLTSEVDSQQRQTSSEVRLRKYVLNENEIFPSASLYKLVLISAVLKEVESAGLKLEDPIYGSKTDLTNRLGSLDFGYDDMPENLEFSVEDALERIGRISDNFAAIMLTDKLRNLWIPGQARDDDSADPLLSMARELGMSNTSFDSASDGPQTSASDIALYFRKLYKGEIVSQFVSDKIMEILALNQINDRIPVGVPEEVKVVHKTGELPMLRHDAGLVFSSDFPNSPNHPYLIILLSKDLEFEDDGVETLANISKGVFDYFNKKD